jgi:hypothetical protein
MSLAEARAGEEPPANAQSTGSETAGAATWLSSYPPPPLLIQGVQHIFLLGIDHSLSSSPARHWLSSACVDQVFDVATHIVF